MPDQNHNDQMSSSEGMHASVALPDDQTTFWERGAERVGEAFGKGFVKVIAGALASALALGLASLFTQKSAVSQSDGHQQWISTNLMNKTLRENEIESNVDELRGEFQEYKSDHERHENLPIQPQWNAPTNFNWILHTNPDGTIQRWIDPHAFDVDGYQTVPTGIKR